MDTYNPYQTPDANLSKSTASPGEHHTPLMVQYLRETKPWVRFLSILGFIGCGLMVLMGVGFSLMWLVTSKEVIPGFGAAFGLIYVLLAALSVAPMVLLHLYANSIAAVVSGGGTQAIEGALLRQKSFWKFLGIFTLVMIALYALFIVVAMGVGIAGALGR